MAPTCLSKNDKEGEKYETKQLLERFPTILIHIFPPLMNFITKTKTGSKPTPHLQKMSYKGGRCNNLVPGEHSLCWGLVYQKLIIQMWKEKNLNFFPFFNWPWLPVVDPEPFHKCDQEEMATMRRRSKQMEILKTIK